MDKEEFFTIEAPAQFLNHPDGRIIYKTGSGAVANKRKFLILQENGQRIILDWDNLFPAGSQKPRLTPREHYRFILRFIYDHDDRRARTEVVQIFQRKKLLYANDNFFNGLPAA